nr:MAG TPA: hypothetical protein [Caudoviricetes sp.]
MEASEGSTPSITFRTGAFFLMIFLHFYFIAIDPSR